MPGATDFLRALLLDVDSARLREVPVEWTVPLQRPVPDAGLRCSGTGMSWWSVAPIWAVALSDAPWMAERLAELGVTFGTSRRSNNVARDERIANTCAAALGTHDDAAAFAALGLMKARVTNRNVSKQIAKALEVGRRAPRDEPVRARRAVDPDDGAGRLGPAGGDDRRRGRGHGRRCGRRRIARMARPGWAGSSRTRPRPSRSPRRRCPPRSRRSRRSSRRRVALERGRIEDLFVEDRDVGPRDLAAALRPSSAQRHVRPTADLAGRGRPAVALGHAGRRTAPSSRRMARLSRPARTRSFGSGTRSMRRRRTSAAWRAALIERQIRQPFKQAFREVYPLTPAEEATGSRSNRFAAHILLYSQARALMQARRWGTNFLGPFDGGDVGIAKREFPSHGLRAEFRHDAIWPSRAGEERGHPLHDRPGPVRSNRRWRARPAARRPGDRVLGGDARRRLVRERQLGRGGSQLAGSRARERCGQTASTRTGASTRTRRSRSWRGPVGMRSSGSCRASRSRIAASSTIDGSWFAATCGHIGSTWAAATSSMEPGDTYLRIVPKPRPGSRRRECSCPSTTTRC